MLLHKSAWSVEIAGRASVSSETEIVWRCEESMRQHCQSDLQIIIDTSLVTGCFKSAARFFFTSIDTRSYINVFFDSDNTLMFVWTFVGRATYDTDELMP